MKPRRKIFDRPTSDLLEQVVEDHKQDTVSIDELKTALHERGFAVLLIIFCMPMCVPVPVPPGYTALFSVPLFILSVQLIAGMDSPWLPRWLRNKRVRRSLIAAIAEKAIPLLRKVERYLKPRWPFATGKTGEQSIGVFTFLFTVSIAVPLPFTNLIPAYGVVLMCLGLLSRDGVTIILGKILGVLGVGITTAILIFGKEIVERII